MFLGFHSQLDRWVAIKHLRGGGARDPEAHEQFRYEAEVMSRVEHPNCVHIYDFLSLDEGDYLISEFVNGGSLREVVSGSGPLTAEQALGLVRGALLGLEHAHARGVIHRDVKPENLLADLDGNSKLADFGLAILRTPGDVAPDGGTPSGSALYMSPEQVEGLSIDERADIYACGAMMFEFLTGLPPYRADNELATMRRHLVEPVPDPRQVRGDIPEGVAILVMRAMSKRPDGRPSSAGEFVAELETAAAAGYGADWRARSSIAAAVGAAAAAGALAAATTAAGSAMAAGAASLQAGGAQVASAVGALPPPIEPVTPLLTPVSAGGSAPAASASTAIPGGAVAGTGIGAGVIAAVVAGVIVAAAAGGGIYAITRPRNLPATAVITRPSPSPA